MDDEHQSSPRCMSASASGRNAVETNNDNMTAPSNEHSQHQDPPSPRKDGHDQSIPRLQTKSSFVRGPESLPSVPESDDDSRSADGMSEARTEDEQHSADEQTIRQDSAPPHEKRAHRASAQFERSAPQQYDIKPKSASTTHLLEAHDKPSAGVKPNNSSISLAPSTGSNAEARAPSTTGLPPVPALPKDVQGFRKTVLASEKQVVVAHAQPVTLQATPSRMKSPPLPSFPGRGLNGGMPGGSPFANAQAPGMPVRRLTTPGMSAPAPFGMAGMGAAQPPAFKSRLSGTTPLVRSPLSSQGTLTPLANSLVKWETSMLTSFSENSPPESEEGSTAGDTRAAQGHTRSQSVKTTKTTASGPGAGRPRRTFAHAGKAAADKDADVVVKEIAEDKKKTEKKKGIKGLFGKKQKS